MKYTLIYTESWRDSEGYWDYSETKVTAYGCRRRNYFLKQGYKVV